MSGLSLVRIGSDGGGLADRQPRSTRASNQRRPDRHTAHTRLGGTGTLLSVILECHPHLSGVLMEREAVVEEARAAIAARGLVQRCEVVAGDFMQGIPAMQAEVAVLSHIIHDRDDDNALAILRKIRVPAAWWATTVGRSRGPARRC
jgi:hypothetical protein